MNKSSMPVVAYVALINPDSSRAFFHQGYEVCV